MPPPTSSTARARWGVGKGAGGLGSKTTLKSIKKSIIVWDRCLIYFENHLGTILASFLLHFWIQIDLDTNLCQKP